MDDLLPKTPSPSMPSPPASLVLRTSCDSCAAAKVKCDKSRPRCNRCIASRSDCVYGISRKHGKCNARAIHGLDRRGGRVTKRPTHTDRGLAYNRRVPAQWSGTVSDHLPFFSTSNPAENISFTPDSHVEDMACRYGTAEGLLGNNQSSQHLDLTEFFTEPLDLSSLGENAARSSGETVSSGEADTGSSVTEDSFGCTLPEPCYSRARSALDLLHRHEPGYVAELDDSLSVNGEALHAVSQMLDCGCSKEPHLAMLSASVVARVLELYQYASRLVSTPTVSYDAQLLSPPASETSFSIARPNSMAPIDSSGMTIKGFDLDEKDQQTMRRLLLLSELRKTAKVVERFSSKPLDAEGDFGNAGDIYTLMGMWLRKELYRATQQIKSK
ncbi:hypothetical protein BDV95DRAFT_598194 [Massariosphaeria phaeospora]|uniref:Zn(2)-C6 fungal-type domain-containing protein n=1 Tax=Massariosphaeria phaeospora TaxID=100035 RepID=A0A7C8MHY4_9PLEO|nr:hypothetical protein BDV95DRAFT_598194 [Massariosphaeria phaeospora]